MAWYYHLNGENQGPVELPELQKLHGQNVITLDTPVWSEGMETWATYGNSSAYSPAVTTVPAVSSNSLTPAVATQTCVECHKPFPEAEMLKYENSWVCPACKPVFFQRIKEGVPSKGALIYASIGARFVAYIIDIIFLQVALSLPVILFFGWQGFWGEGVSSSTNILISVVQCIVSILYEIVLTTVYGATLGKMAMKIKVVTAEGGPISYGRSTGRYFAKGLSALIFCVGYLMAIWDPEKRALHDRICGTRVISVS